MWGLLYLMEGVVCDSVGVAVQWGYLGFVYV